MEVIKSLLTKSNCYRINQYPGNDNRYTTFQKKGPLGFMLHSVGCPQPSAKVFMKIWNNPYYTNACVHGVIDANDGKVYQTLPWNYRGWHGGYSVNETHIGVEMCEPDCIHYYSGANFTVSDKERAIAMTRRTYNSAVKLFAGLCREYNKDPLEDGVIISHREGAERGIATRHADPSHLWEQLGLEYTMDGFRKDVKAAMEAGEKLEYQEDDEMRYYRLKDVPSYYREETVDRLVDQGIIKGRGEASGDETIIDLGEDAIRTFVMLDRAGVFKK